VKWDRQGLQDKIPQSLDYQQLQVLEVLVGLVVVVEEVVGLLPVVLDLPQQELLLLLPLLLQQELLLLLPLLLQQELLLLLSLDPLLLLLPQEKLHPQNQHHHKLVIRQRIWQRGQRQIQNLLLPLPKEQEQEEPVPQPILKWQI
jgi:hypothetical protein